MQNFTNTYVYARGATRPKLIMFDSGTPYGVAVGSNGSVYVAENGFTTGVDVFPKGMFESVLHDCDPSFSAVYSVFVDGRATCTSADAHHRRWPGAVFQPRLARAGHQPGAGRPRFAVQFEMDRSGNLLVGDYAVSVIDVYPPGAKSPSKQIAANNVGYVALNSAKNSIWAPAFTGHEFVDPASAS